MKNHSEFRFKTIVFLKIILHLQFTAQIVQPISVIVIRIGKTLSEKVEHRD